MGTVVGIVQGQQFTDQRVCLLNTEPCIALDGCLAGHRRHTGCKVLQGLSARVRAQAVQHLLEEFPLRQSEQILRDRADGIVMTSEGFDLISDLPEVFHIGGKKILLRHGKRQDDGRTDHLRGGLLAAVLPHQPLEHDFLMGCMLVDDIHVILEFDDPVCIEDLSDQAVLFAMLLSEEFCLACPLIVILLIRGLAV